tara:strand:- start:29 stop:172 length:144 start_codon:yes stop_codon:yes gene_type:complete
MVENIWDGCVLLLVGILFGILLFKIVLLPEGANVFEINKNVVHHPPL